MENENIEQTDDIFDPQKIAEENSAERAVLVGYRCSDYKWFGVSVPEFLVQRCVLCESVFNIKRKKVLSNGVNIYEACPECKRKSIVSYDVERWKNFVLFELWNFEFFIDQFSTPYCAFCKDGQTREIFALKSDRMRGYMANRVSTEGKLKNAFLYMEGLARNSGKQITLANRMTVHDGAIWIDLCDDKWQALRIADGKKEVIRTPPILFKRFSHQAEMKIDAGEKKDLDAFIELMNLAPQTDDDKSKLMFAGFLATLFIPKIDRPILIPIGPQGSAKTTLSAAVRLLADPCIEPDKFATQHLPKDAKDLPQKLSHHYIPTFDNCNYINQEVADILCQVCTGAGFSKRKLWSDDDDIIYAIHCPVIMNGLAPPTHMQDFMDRTLLISLDRILEQNRKEKKEIWARRDALLPKVRGYLIDVVAKARITPTPEYTSLPRLADFAVNADACMVHIGRPQGEFVKEYIKIANETAKDAIESDPLASALVSLLDEKNGWNGSASDLYKELRGRENSSAKDADFPKNSIKLSEALFGRLKPGLLQLGWIVSKERNGSGRRILITKMSAEMKQNS